MKLKYILLISLVFYICVDGWGNKDKVHLRDEVKVITLKKGDMTTGRRSRPLPQLKCVGGSAREYAGDIEVVQCKNMGSDGFDVQWKCETDMDKSLKFGKIEVSCEGYEYPDDPYILRGSCGLEYTLEYTGNGRPHHQPSHSHSSYFSDDYAHESQSSGKVAKLFMFGIVVFIFYNIYKQCLMLPSGGGNPPGATGGYGGGSWGPGGGGPGGPYGPGNPSYSASCQPPVYPSNTAGGAGWRPGFWSGMAAGGILGNMFNRPSYGGGGGLFGRPAGGYGYSGGSRSASGFGGTRRR